MSDLENHIKLVNDKLLLLLKAHASIKKENENLKIVITNFKQKEDDYKSSLYELNQKVSILKAAANEMTDADQKEFEKRITNYIREIDKCIGLLSD